LLCECLEVNYPDCTIVTSQQKGGGVVKSLNFHSCALTELQIPVSPTSKIFLGWRSSKFQSITAPFKPVVMSLLAIVFPDTKRYFDCLPFLYVNALLVGFLVEQKSGSYHIILLMSVFLIPGITWIIVQVSALLIEFELE